MRRLVRDERGAEVIEFAIVLPIAMVLLLGTMYALLVVSAQMSLQHAVNVGARTATLPDATTQAVETRALDATPFFHADTCETTTSGAAVDNAPVAVDMDCPFPNPLGRVVAVFAGQQETGPFAPELHLTARGTGRRE